MAMLSVLAPTCRGGILALITFKPSTPYTFNFGSTTPNSWRGALAHSQGMPDSIHVLAKPHLNVCIVFIFIHNVTEPLELFGSQTVG